MTLRAIGPNDPPPDPLDHDPTGALGRLVDAFTDVLRSFRRLLDTFTDWLTSHLLYLADLAATWHHRAGRSEEATTIAHVRHLVTVHARGLYGPDLAAELYNPRSALRFTLELLDRYEADVDAILENLEAELDSDTAAMFRVTNEDGRPWV